MTRQSWILLFIVAVLADIAGSVLKNQLADYIFKPFIVISIAGLFIGETSFATSPFKKWVLLALVFSWIGDVMLLFQQDRQIFFLLGLCSFLIAHIFYIIFFNTVRVKENVKLRVWPVLFVLVYYAGLILFLSPYLHEMKLPVRIYGIAISIMLMLAIHMLYIQDKLAGGWIMAGALLFVISDSILAINNFYHSFQAAGPLIMLTYGFAQLFITFGASKFIASDFKE